MKKIYIKPTIELIDIDTHAPLATSGSENPSMSFGDSYDDHNASYQQFSLEEDNAWGIDWHANDK